MDYKEVYHLWVNRKPIQGRFHDVQHRGDVDLEIRIIFCLKICNTIYMADHISGKWQMVFALYCGLTSPLIKTREE